MSSPTKTDFPTQIGRNPIIDPRLYGAIGDGVHDDAPAIQAALNAAGSGSITSNVGLTQPMVVQLPPGKFLLKSALTMANDGIVLQGFGMEGQGLTVDSFCSILYLDSTYTSTSSSVITVSKSSSTWFRGGSIKNISIDVSNCPTFNSSSASPAVISLLGVSNCQDFKNIAVIGHTGTALLIGPTSGGQICENLRIEGLFAYGGLTSSGGLTTVSPTAPGVIVKGADNIQIVGSFIVYYKTTISVLGTTSDMAGVQIMSAAIGAGVNTISNGFVMERTAFTNYALGARLTPVNVSGTNYCPQYCRFSECLFEAIGIGFQINQELGGTNAGFWRSQVYVRGCQFGTTSKKFVGSNMQGGFLEIDWLGSTGDLTLSATTDAVPYVIGPNPNGAGSFFNATDAGTNFGTYLKPGLAIGGAIMTGQLRLAGNTAPASTNAGTSSATPLSCWGDTVRLWSAGRLPANSSAPGALGEVCINATEMYWHNGAQWLKLVGVTF